MPFKTFAQVPAVTMPMHRLSSCRDKGAILRIRGRLTSRVSCRCKSERLCRKRLQHNAAHPRNHNAMSCGLGNRRLERYRSSGYHYSTRVDRCCGKTRKCRKATFAGVHLDFSRDQLVNLVYLGTPSKKQSTPNTRTPRPSSPYCLQGR